MSMYVISLPESSWSSLGIHSSNSLNRVPVDSVLSVERWESTISDSLVV